MIIAGIDPGKEGYCVALDILTKTIWKYPINFDRNGILNLDEFENEFFGKIKPDLIILEKVMGRGGWGATQTFSMGLSYGQIHLATKKIGVPYRLVIPQTWQKLIFEGITQKLPAKIKANLAYRQLFPNDPIPNLRGSKNKNENIVDALLIATYGIMKYGDGNFLPFGPFEWGE